MNPSALYLAVRDVDTGAGDGRPQLPGTWSVQPIESAPVPAWDVRRPDGQILTVVRANMIGARGLYAVAGDRDYLETVSGAAPGREVWRKAQAGPGPERTAARAWRWWRCDVTERDPETGDPVRHDGVTRELVPEGVTLPASALPWDLDENGGETVPLLAVRRVHALARPVLQWTVAGFGLHERCEHEPDRGA